MTITTVIEDAIVAFLFLAMIGLASESLRRQLVEAGYQGRSVLKARRFFWCAVLYTLVFIGCGILRQTSTLLGWPAYVIFGVLIVLGAVGWTRLRRIPMVKKVNKRHANP